ncbi:sulfite exporter TauE/SafE family protein [Pontibacter sp. 172403-2]|uniref:sulfite exporter TauE/SafE family protein n=1 Tax=Pontibacter rufus TaxID=2791028 RepID=UPI0018AFC704|nr:sulfite exporter TauE/SafE family protein [Pontibacter sp. 172403-2]MBF9253716.1 sulfite exporter TauE/SafE family protein [Pontibacter sp. 172403-2]
MEVLGYTAALLIGLSLGLTGSGGSILTVPILVYLLRLNPVISMAYSLFVVGTTSLVGSYRFYQKDLVSFRTALIFGIPSLVTVFLTRRFVIPAIPQHIATFNSLVITKDLLLMLLFAVLMIFAAFSMIRKGRQPEPADEKADNHTPNTAALLVQGVLVGLISGLVGAGGGFLIIPALVLFSKLDMKMAVGTSLLIISANSLFGFAGDILNYSIDWKFLILFSMLSVAGIFAGTALSHRIAAYKLKYGFGWFVLLMGIYILIKEIFLS